MTLSSALVLALLAALPARADDAPDLRALFPQRADVRIAPPGGLVRLDLPPAILGACRADLSDLRLVDRGGHEVPYLLDAGPSHHGAYQTTQTAVEKLLDVRREETRRENAPARQREVYVMAAPAGEPATGTWDLILTASRPVFVRRIDVGAVQADGSVTPLLEDQSVFRLVNPPRDRMRLPLPRFAADRISVTLEGEEGNYLEPMFRFETSIFTPAREQAKVPLRETARRGEAGRTIVELERPRGIVPGSLRVETTTRSFSRDVEVWDEGQGLSPLRIGSLAVFRIEGVTAAEGREIALLPARGERLRVEIADRDSPALDGLAFVALVARPALIFSLATEAADEPAATLYFGGGRADAPRYDLAAFVSLLSGTSIAARASAATRLLELPAVELGAAGENPLFDATPALAFAMHAGAPIDPRLYTHRRTVRVTPSSEGLTRLTLQAEDLAHARSDLGDVRVVDDDAHQWPYLLDPNATREWQPLRMERTQPRRGVSRYALALPTEGPRIDQVRLAVDTHFFDRAYRLFTADGAARPLASGRLSRRAGQTGDVAIGFAAQALAALVLEIDDGDDAPLKVQSAQAELILPDLFLAAPADDYTLLVGNPDATAPRYELERVRNVVLAVPSVPAVLGESVANPALSERARLTSGERRDTVVPQVLLWSALLAGVAVLTVITLRLARKPAE